MLSEPWLWWPTVQRFPSQRNAPAPTAAGAVADPQIMGYMKLYNILLENAQASHGTESGGEVCAVGRHGQMLGMACKPWRVMA